MDNQSNSAPPSRMAALIVVVVFASLLAFNHYESVHYGKVYIAIITLAPLFCLLGLGGLIDPRLTQAMGPNGRSHPVLLKVAGLLLALTGMAISAYLALGVYHIGAVPASAPTEGSETSRSAN